MCENTSLSLVSFAEKCADSVYGLSVNCLFSYSISRRYVMFLVSRVAVNSEPEDQRPPKFFF